VSDKDYMEKPCKHCPYRHDVKPFLTPERGEELAYITENPYSHFACHKTTEHDDESDSGEMLVTENSKTCAGFLTLMANNVEDGYLPDGFKPSWELCYSEAYEMADAYDDTPH